MTQTQTQVNKHIRIGVPGAEGTHEYKNVELLPGTRAMDILKKLNLENMALLKADGTEFAPTESVYDNVSEGQKLYASPRDVTAG
ncbi:MAG: hypothetical protein HY671_04170 [Chloroflexi bacterium]|nr:hypothetical protein [Chloroflexota bacterium]